MKRIAFFIVAALLIGTAVYADDMTQYFVRGGGINIFVGGSALSESNPLPVSPAEPSRVSQANITSLCATVPNASTAVTLTAASRDIDIYTSDDASILHVNFANGTATTSNAAIYPGGAYHYTGTAISAFKVIGEGTSGSYNVVAK